ncbi:calcineurin-like phosphoesterase C-terminal domain-containing protein [Runella slithyformis]|uniref:Metallophosphoesterase n=1 Tax=Runella slithyformis (strain ATCC 29530 / DSM 19594 / LMG 11500 / NCIMB 11436 / LSU 4) TaxID=761193 RepID=A0A7U4E6C6_RUNSL|nr:calcineurin-like phosphoesterase family protein [Runella slithyformis]AEI49194.1 metallophosphoesterase [Runella slithyformis DSM 19594]
MKHLLSILCLFVTQVVCAQTTAVGTVYHDLNKNGRKEAGEPGIAHVGVSNGKEVVKTDKNGKWTLPVGDDTGFFVIKPAEYAVPLTNDQLPKHYYLHKPNGSPSTKSEGVAPTGALPNSIDFPLWKQKTENRFSVLLFSDSQTRGLAEVNHVTHDVVEECIGTRARFGISLGDIVADDPNLFAEVNGSIGQIGVPWYNVFGNHDFNRGATNDQFSDETFERFYGPSTYAFEEGQVAFIALKNVYFSPDGKYKGHFTETQLAFVKNYLAQVPNDKLVVLLMHIPIVICDNRTELFQLIENRPHTFSASGHTHTMINLWVDEKYGWKNAVPHHHFVNATISGSWWCGLKDETGIPHATMNDGAPNGYSILTFDGNQYSVRFKAARRPDDYQMNIYWPDELTKAALDTTHLRVNVFAGSSRSKVEFQVAGQTTWTPLQLTPQRDPSIMTMHRQSPYLEATVNGTKLDEVFGWSMDKPGISTHIWQGNLRADLVTGTYRIIVRTTDAFGQMFTAHRIFRVK